MDLAKTTQSLTTAADMREMTQMLMQPYANWEEYLTPAPISIAIMGELGFLSSDVNKDFSINKNPPPNGYQYLKYPDSFRACLMHFYNSASNAFLEAHTNMDQIRMDTATIPFHMMTACRILFDPSDQITETMLPNELESISEIADHCVTLAEGVQKKFSDVIHLIYELLEACTNAQLFNEEERKKMKMKIEEGELRQQAAEEFKQRSKKVMDEMGKQVEEAHNCFTKAMDSIPSGWEMVGMDAVQGLVKAVTGFIVGVTTVMVHGMVGGFGGGGGGSSEQSHSEKGVDISFSDIQMLSSSVPILKIIGFLTQNVSKDGINWKELYDQKEDTMKSEWIKYLLKLLSDQFEGNPDSPAKKGVFSLLNGGIDVCERLATYKPDQKWDSEKTKRLIGDLQTLHEEALTFDTANKKYIGSPALDPTSPMVSKADTENMSAGQAAMEAARLRIEQSREQLKQTREQYNKSVENMEKSEKELTDILTELRSCKIKETDFETTIKMLVKGLDAMGRVKEQWEKMVRFFQMVSNIINTSLKRTINQFVTTAQTSQKISYSSNQFIKDLLYNQVFQTSNIASLVHMISGTYTEISGKYLMDRVSSLSKLMTMDQSKPQFMMERVKFQDSCTESQNGILQRVRKNKEDFEKRTDARMAQIEEGLNAVLPAASPKEIERMREIVQNGFSDKALVQYT